MSLGLQPPKVLDTIQVCRIPVTCIIGVLPLERTTPQAVELDLTLRLDVSAAAASEDLGKTVDYKALADVCTLVLQQGAFLLIETAAVALCQVALHFGAKAGVLEVTVRLAKPTALGGQGVPALTVTRQIGQLPPPKTTPEGGLILFQGGQTEIALSPVSGLASARRRS